MIIRRKLYVNSFMGQEELDPHTRHRLHKEDSARTEPNRNWSTLYRQPHSWGFHTTSAEPPVTAQEKQEPRSENIVSHGVELGYRVVEEHIRQGQHTAQQINNHPPNSHPRTVKSDIQTLIERLARYYTDLGSVWGDLINSLAADPNFLDNLLRPLQPQPVPAMHNGTPKNRAATVAIEVTSPRPTQVILDLHPGAEGLLLTTPGLHAVDSQKPPLTEVIFEPSIDDGNLCLRIRVPDGHPPGTYTGVIVDREAHVPRGTLSIRIRA